MKPSVNFDWDDVTKRKDILTELTKVRDWLRFLESMFNRHELGFGHGTDNARDEAAWAIAEVLMLDVVELTNHLSATLISDEKEALYDLAKARCVSKKPLAFILGKAYLAGFEFLVNEHVHVPKSPIPQLIGERFEPWLEREPQLIADCCTGSGSLAILLAAAFDDAIIHATDIDEKALEVSKRNIALYGFEERVKLHQSNLLNAVIQQKFDLIVANPPYVSEEDWQLLPEEYHQEPKIALVSDDDGLRHTFDIIRQAEKCLAPGGILVVEVGLSWIKLQEALPDAPLLWPDFPEGGEGVFVLHQEDLAAVVKTLPS